MHERFIARIIDDSYCGMSDVAFRIASPISGPSCFTFILHRSPMWSSKMHCAA